MNKQYRVWFALAAGIIVLGAGPCLAAQQGKTTPTLHRDGSVIENPNRITQADRQAAAQRAKARGLKVQKAGAEASQVPAIKNNGAANTKEGQQ